VNAQRLFENGQLSDAIASLSAELRTNPTDVSRRTFLFELLCFAGAYDRAERQLDVLRDASHEAEMGTLLYRSAIAAERRRAAMFEEGTFPMTATPPAAVSGMLNGRRFSSLADADPRIGARLELFVAGQYMWLPLQHVASLKIAEPRRLRDLLWIQTHVTPSPQIAAMELGEVLMPALTPLAWQHQDDSVRLGRVSDWVRLLRCKPRPVRSSPIMDEIPLARIPITRLPLPTRAMTLAELLQPFRRASGRRSAGTSNTN
jgi:type VI secretion system protein ImpE